MQETRVQSLGQEDLLEEEIKKNYLETNENKSTVIQNV